MGKHALSRSERRAEIEAGLKTCLVCKVQQPLASYPNNKSKLDGKAAVCFACYPDYLRAAKYGVTADKFNSMLQSQGGLCAMCHEPCSDWCVDHDHNCCPDNKGKTCGNCVRALLCGPCNRSLGHYEKVQKQAEEYLRRFQIDS